MPVTGVGGYLSNEAGTREGGWVKFISTNPMFISNKSTQAVIEIGSDNPQINGSTLVTCPVPHDHITSLVKR